MYGEVHMRVKYNISPLIRYEQLKDILLGVKVVRVNHFDEEGLEDFEDDLNYALMTGQPIVPVEIDSYGGQSYGLLGMVAAIESCPVPIATIITSKAMSAGALLFCFGAEGYRFMHPNASMMIHDAAFGTSGKIEEVKVDTKHTDWLNKSIYKRASKHLGHDEDYLMSMIQEQKHLDWFLTAKEAKKHNIANHLKVPSFEVKVSVDFNFVS